MVNEQVTLDIKFSQDFSKNPLEILNSDYIRWQNLFQMQPAEIQHYLESQAQNLVTAYTHHARQAWFLLPESVQLDESGTTIYLMERKREYHLKNWVDRIFHRSWLNTLRYRLDELEADSDEAVSLGAGLIRFSTAMQLIYHTMPEGKNVTYRPLAGEEIPTIPDVENTDASVPFPEQFMVPKWVVVDEDNNLLVATAKDAEKAIVEMQHYFSVFHMAVRLAPYMIADREYQRKRTGILGQMINQGRALCWFQTRAIINLIHKRAEMGSLNRGLSISLPYFDDQDLLLKTYEFQIIPPGRIMFLWGFVARACRNEQAKVAQDTRLSASTKNHLLGELRLLENAFEPKPE